MKLLAGNICKTSLNTKEFNIYIAIQKQWDCTLKTNVNVKVLFSQRKWLTKRLTFFKSISPYTERFVIIY